MPVFKQLASTKAAKSNQSVIFLVGNRFQVRQRISPAVQSASNAYGWNVERSDLEPRNQEN